MNDNNSSNSYDKISIETTSDYPISIGITKIESKSIESLANSGMKDLKELNNHRLKPEGLDYGLEVLIRVA